MHSLWLEERKYPSDENTDYKSMTSKFTEDNESAQHKGTSFFCVIPFVYN